MIYKAPFYAMQKAVYAALSQSDSGLQWYDSAVPIEEIAELHKNQAEFAYGIVDCSCEYLPYRLFVFKLNFRFCRMDVDVDV